MHHMHTEKKPKKTPNQSKKTQGYITGTFTSKKAICEMYGYRMFTSVLPKFITSKMRYALKLQELTAIILNIQINLTRS